MSETMYKGTVRGDLIELDEECSLPEGTRVLITLVDPVCGSPQTVLQAAKSPPRIVAEDIVTLNTLIEEGKQPLRYRDPFRPGKKP